MNKFPSAYFEVGMHDAHDMKDATAHRTARGEARAAKYMMHDTTGSTYSTTPIHTVEVLLFYVLTVRTHILLRTTYAILYAQA